MPAVRLDAAKWASRSSQAGGEYAQGIGSPKRSWSAAAAAAKDNYALGVQEAISRGGYEKGVSSAGDAKWQTRARDVGRARFQQGVTVSQAEYQKGFQPYASVIQGVTLAPRGPKGQNYGRVQAIGDALRAAKLAA